MRGIVCICFLFQFIFAAQITIDGYKDFKWKTSYSKIHSVLTDECKAALSDTNRYSASTTPSLNSYDDDSEQENADTSRPYIDTITSGMASIGISARKLLGNSYKDSLLSLTYTIKDRDTVRSYSYFFEDSALVAVCVTNSSIKYPELLEIMSSKYGVAPNKVVYDTAQEFAGVNILEQLNYMNSEPMILRIRVSAHTWSKQSGTAILGTMTSNEKELVERLGEILNVALADNMFVRLAILAQLQETMKNYEPINVLGTYYISNVYASKAKSRVKPKPKPSSRNHSDY
jgi:hypothetical protein